MTKKKVQLDIRAFQKKRRRRPKKHVTNPSEVIIKSCTNKKRKVLITKEVLESPPPPKKKVIPTGPFSRMQRYYRRLCLIGTKEKVKHWMRMEKKLNQE